MLSLIKSRRSSTKERNVHRKGKKEGKSIITTSLGKGRKTNQKGAPIIGARDVVPNVNNNHHQVLNLTPEEHKQGLKPALLPHIAEQYKPISGRSGNLDLDKGGDPIAASGPTTIPNSSSSEAVVYTSTIPISGSKISSEMMAKVENDFSSPHPARTGQERPSSRSGMERPSSRNSNSGRSRQPRLGISSSSYMFDDDSGIMSEVETSSTRFRKISSGGKEKIRHPRPRTSPNQPPRGYSPMGVPSGEHRAPNDSLPPPPSSSMYDDDSGIMSEAETSSTTRSNRRSRNYYSMSLNRPNGKPLSTVSSTLFEEDPGIMSEAETASTSSTSRKAQKYTLPVVRTPSKTLERPLGMVFLIYRGETKRAILPNEITSIITVKALFVRSFNKILTLDYLDSPRVKLYIHDSKKDQFYDLDKLSDIRDRTILKVFEVDSSGKGPAGLGPAGLPPITNIDEVSGEPEYVDSQYVKANKLKAQKEKHASKTLPRNTFSGIDPAGASLSSMTAGVSGKVSNSHGNPGLGERSKTLAPGFLRGHRLNTSLVGGRVESGYVSSPDGNFDFEQTSALSRVVPSRFSSSSSQGRYYHGPANTEEAKARMMHMEAQLSQLTGMVEKALKHKKLGKKQVSFDKTVTYNDDQPPSILTTSKRHQQQQIMQKSQSNHHHHHHHHQQQQQADVHGRLKKMHRSTKELKQEVRVLKRLTQLQSMAMKDLVQDTYLKLREACISFSSQNGLMSTTETLEHWRIAQDEEVFSRELNDLFKNISELEAKVEEVRSGVINKKNKILLSDVEEMAIKLSNCSKTVTQLRQAYPTLEANLNRSNHKTGQEVKDSNMMKEFLKRSTERLDNAWKRCKKLTGTLVTLKRLASVQEQRFHPGSTNIALTMDMSLSPSPGSFSSAVSQKESSLDDLLDALQSYSVQPCNSGSVKNTKDPPHFQAPKASPTVVQTAKVKPQSHLAETNQPKEQVTKVANGNVPKPPPRTVTATKSNPPPPPPRTSSTHKSATSGSNGTANPGPPVAPKPDLLNSNIFKQDALETRHQELLTRQKQLQEQYLRLQEMQKRSSNSNSANYSVTTMDQTAPGETLPVNNNQTIDDAADSKTENNINSQICETDIV